MSNNFGLPYKGGLGSALRIGSTSFGIDNTPSYSSQTFYQSSSPRISGVNTTVLANEPFVFTYRILTELTAGNIGGGNSGPSPIYRGDISTNMKLTLNFVNPSNCYFTFIGTETNPQGGICRLLYNIPFTTNTLYNIVLYKNELPFTSSSAYRLYLNGINMPFNFISNLDSVLTPPAVRNSITFNDIVFGGNNGTYQNTYPLYVFNNSVFKLDSGLTSTYIDELVLELHRVDNYVHLLPTAYSVNPSKVVYYFPLYLKEGRDIRDYYNPSKKFKVDIAFGNSNIFFNQSSDLVTTGTSNYTTNQPTQSASIYKGPFNVWSKPYPPYEPYI